MWGTGRSRERGATLLEMMAALAIVGVVSALVFPQLGRAARRAQLSRDRAIMVADLRGARAEAARTGRSVKLEIASDGTGYEKGGRRIRDFAGERLFGEPEAVVFFPDGSSDGADWILAGRTGRLAAAVEPGVGSVTEPDVR
jgi:prepilin-type N-terminal cleavage/methylation domain-containing protein